MESIIAYREDKKEREYLIYQKSYLLADNIQELLSNLKNTAQEL